MSKLGICPTCKKSISINAHHCPHCGETEFGREILNQQYNRTEICYQCKGYGAYHSKYKSECQEWPEEGFRYLRFCETCAGTGFLDVYNVTMRLDKRIDLVVANEWKYPAKDKPDVVSEKLRPHGYIKYRLADW